MTDRREIGLRGADVFWGRLDKRIFDALAEPDRLFKESPRAPKLTRRRNDGIPRAPGGKLKRR